MGFTTTFVPTKVCIKEPKTLPDDLQWTVAILELGDGRSCLQQLIVEALVRQLPGHPALQPLRDFVDLTFEDAVLAGRVLHLDRDVLLGV